MEASYEELCGELLRALELAPENHRTEWMPLIARAKSKLWTDAVIRSHEAITGDVEQREP